MKLFPTSILAMPVAFTITFLSDLFMGRYIKDVVLQRMSYRNTIPFIIFFLLLPCNSPAFDLHYDLSIVNPSSGKGNIQISVSNFNQNLLEIGTFATYVVPKRNIYNLTAVDSEGKSLPVTKKSGNPSFLPNNSDIWEIQTPGITEITINYEFQPTKGPVDWLADLVYFGYITEKFAVFLAEYVFLIPGRNYQFESFSASFYMPANWKVVCPWPKRENKYFPSDLFYSGDLYNIMGATALSFGDLSTYLHQIGSAKFTTAIYGEESNNNQKTDMANRLAKLFQYYTQIWKTSIDYPYLYAIFPHANDGSWILESAGPLSRHVSLYDFYSYYQNKFPSWYAASFELFEVRWLAGEWGIMLHGNPTLWMKRGISHAYAYKAPLNIGEIDSTTIINEIKKDFGLYQSCVENGCDGSLANAEWSGHPEYELARHKGGLVIFLLANEILIQSNGRKNFDGLLAILFSKYGMSENYITTELLKSEIEVYTNKSFTDFFDKYVYGTTVLPYNTFFKDDDGDGLTNVLEVLKNTNSNKSDTDGDGYSDKEEIDAGTDPTDRRSCPGPCPDIAMPWIPFLLLDD